MTPQDYPELLKFAKSLAVEAGALMRQYFHMVDQGIEQKADDTPVTMADQRINAMVVERVKAAYPEHGVLGEEESWQADRPELWVCDPIDGTRGFIIGEPTSVFSLAFVVDGKPVVAVMLDPFQERLYSAVKGQGSYCGDKRNKVSGRGLKGASIIGPGSFTEIERQLTIFQGLRDDGARVHMFGGFVFKGGLIAEGRIEGVIFPGRSAHDVAAVKLLVEEAGGKVTDLMGQEQRYDGPILGAIISNGVIHEELLRAVQEFDAEEFLGY